MLSCPLVRFLSMNLIKSFIATFCECFFLTSFFIINHCCSITVNFPVAYILVPSERYILMIVVLLFCWHRTIINIHRHILEESCPLFKMARIGSLVLSLLFLLVLMLSSMVNWIQKHSSWPFVFAKFFEVSVQILLSRGISSGHLLQ